MTDLRDHFHLFVYGTLKSGERSNVFLKDCSLVGAGSVNGILYNIDDEYPALILYGPTPVHGEVWRCPADKLWELDVLEGVPESLYRRVGVEATLAGGEPIAAWTYAAGPALTKKLVPSRRIAHWP